jgi:hypothetical protein
MAAITLIGSGKAATVLGKALKASGHKIFFTQLLLLIFLLSMIMLMCMSFLSRMIP